MGHFGKRPIRIAWAGLVLPALALNYAGQGALLLRDPKALENPFFLSFPPVALVPAVIIATAATIIASQAVISGAYSLTPQAIQLGLLPHAHRAHVRARARPDLRAVRELGAARRDRAGVRRLREFVRDRVRVRHRGD